MLHQNEPVSNVGGGGDGKGLVETTLPLILPLILPLERGFHVFHPKIVSLALPCDLIYSPSCDPLSFLRSLKSLSLLSLQILGDLPCNHSRFRRYIS